MLLSATFSVAMAQKKDTFMIEAIPIFDMDGNVYRRVQFYDHPPTAQDSLLFFEKLNNDKLKIRSSKPQNKPKNKGIHKSKVINKPKK